MHIIPDDFARILLPDTPIVEIFLRGTITYVALFLLLRLALKRQSSNVGITNLLVIVLIADAAQNAMAGGYESIPDGILLVATILFWSFALDWLGFRFPDTVGRMIHPGPLLLIDRGRLVRENMRHELITHEELMTQLRTRGIEHVEEVERAFIEGNGEFSIVRRDHEETDSGQRRQTGA